MEEQEREKKWNETKKYIDDWRKSNFKDFNRIFEFKIFILKDGYAQGGEIISKKTGKKYIFREWSSSLRRACRLALNNILNEYGYSGFKQSLIRTYLEDWVNVQEEKLNLHHTQKIERRK